MCIAVSYKRNNLIIFSRFSDLNAKLPMLSRGKILTEIVWGRHSYESGNLPLGGWLNLISLHDNSWDRYFPKLIKIPALKFMEKNIEEKSHWFPITNGHYIQGALLSFHEEKRLYIVTISPKLENSHYLRWPLIVS